MPSFTARLQNACAANQSLVCVGLDPDPARMPIDDVVEFNRAIVESTADQACAYKPNLAFYEALGMPGLRALESTVALIRQSAPSAVIIGDAKRGDIGPSAEAYAKAMFQVWNFDAVTLNAWGGRDTVEPFLGDEQRGVFIWCRGSNPGSVDLQDLKIESDSGKVPLYQHLAAEAQTWNAKDNLGLVVGATFPEQLAQVRTLGATMPLLIPGVGAQGGDLEAAIRNGTDAEGRLAIINSSRGIIYASTGPDFAEAARRAASDLREAINRVLDAEGKGWP
ncbi:MAG: orotidine-5'-phosphate decarboxylase [Chloroflexi bacterium]|nr:orotidine-5'-phosphate decarboxylase [Chloroflexota bacterium]MDA1217913.1 orotidine-5'-phosphate decarboxylase [Chloroflexota bacterium]PKB57820.1 MAG: orotidine-5'-phosphate decarboxylase [SAR202 cluster bacterium Casp-Chloro-G3]